MRRLRQLSGAFILVCALPHSALAEPIITKSYSYFRIGGLTAEDLDLELEKRGPMTQSSGHRHPGATEIKFGGDITYLERGGQCSVGGVKVTLRTKIILPRWTNRKRASRELGLIWDTLQADIKRHEERHAEIARTYARDLERELLSLSPERGCKRLEARVAETTKRILDEHDRQQQSFDRIESTNFDDRMSRLLRYRKQQGG